MQIVVTAQVLRKAPAAKGVAPIFIEPKSEGIALGGSVTLSDKQKQDVRDDLATGTNMSDIAKAGG